MELDYIGSILLLFIKHYHDRLLRIVDVVVSGHALRFYYNINHTTMYELKHRKHFYNPVIYDRLPFKLNCRLQYPFV